MKKVFLFIACIVIIISFSACNNVSTSNKKTYEKNKNVIVLSDDSSTIDGTKIEEFDYEWHCDPSQVHTDVEDAPAEYYTGTKPETESSVYIDHELFYFPKLEQSKFKQINYDGENEWAYYYTDSKNSKYIFATLPSLGNSFPSNMMHTEEEAENNKVLHITKPGTYILQGKWTGQIKVDLGEKDDVFTDENAKVNLILNGVEINCTVAPGIIFNSVYECDNKWEDQEKHDTNVSTENAGANIILADDSENIVNGNNVFRMLKTKYKDDSSTDKIKVQKKMRKTDGALYSYQTLNIDCEKKGNGKLTINSNYEGLDSELHLAINGGNLIINSDDDGINVNEDNVSVAIFNDGITEIHAANGAEGDGVDSNGFILLNGGEISVDGCTPPDNAFDSEDGIIYNGGKIIIDKKEQELKKGETIKEISAQNNEMQNKNEQGNPPDKPEGMKENEAFNKTDFDIKDFKKKIAALNDDATLDDVLKILGMNDFPSGNKPPQNPPDNRTESTTK